MGKARDPQRRGPGAFSAAIPPLPPKPRQSPALKRPTPRAVDLREGWTYIAVGWTSEHRHRMSAHLNISFPPGVAPPRKRPGTCELVPQDKRPACGARELFLQNVSYGPYASVVSEALAALWQRHRMDAHLNISFPPGVAPPRKRPGTCELVPQGRRAPCGGAAECTPFPRESTTPPAMWIRRRDTDR